MKKSLLSYLLIMISPFVTIALVQAQVSINTEAINYGGSNVFFINSGNSPVGTAINGAGGTVRTSLRVSDNFNSLFNIAHPSSKVIAIGGNTDHELQLGGFQNDLSAFTPHLSLLTDGNINLNPGGLLSGFTVESGGSDPIYNMDMNFRFTDRNTDLVGASFRIDGRINDPIFNWLYRAPGSLSEQFLMVIRRTGNVGIGLNDPSCKLDVDGDICSNGNMVTSDKRFKQNIRPIENPIEKILQIEGVTYSMRTKDFSNRHFTEGQKLGLIAQNVEKVFPELVQEMKDGFKAVNYDGMIPVLVEAVKEQQTLLSAKDREIADLRAQVRQQEERLARLERLMAAKQEEEVNDISLAPISDARLKQNQPNPFSDLTDIQYIIPNEVRQAELRISDVQGRVLKTIVIDQRGEGRTSLQANGLSAGTYFYSLILDGQVQGTKKMVLTKND